MTLISCRTRVERLTELVSRKVCTMVSTWVARTIRLRIEYFWSERTNSVRSSGPPGSFAPTPRITPTPGSASGAWPIPPPQKVSSPVMRTRLPTASAEPDAAPLAQHVVEGVLQLGPDALRLVHDHAPRVALLPRLHIEGHRVEHPQLELGRKVGHIADRSHQQGVGGHREVRQIEHLGQASEPEQDGHGLLGAHDGDRDD